MSPVVAPLISLLSFLAVVMLVQTTAGLLFAANDRTRRVNRRLRMLQAGKSRDEVVAKLVRRPAGSALPGLEWSRLYDRLALDARQAGLAISPDRLILHTLAAGGALWVASLVFWLRTSTGAALLVNAGLSLAAALGVAFLVMFVWLRRLRAQRIRRLEQQLPVGIDIVVRAIRAGHPVVSAIQLAAEELGDPLGAEFGLVVDETTYGVDFEQALMNFARQTGCDDAHYFAVSVNVQATTGGNLAEVLEGLAKVIRGRLSLSKRVKALSSEGRTSAVIISLMPIFVICVQMLANPRAYSDKFSDPVFLPVVLITALAYLNGWLIVRRIINFRY